MPHECHVRGAGVGAGHRGRAAQCAAGRRAAVSPRSGAHLVDIWLARLLKIKHVPEQPVDVTMFLIMFTLMFTYLFGGALAGSTQEYLQSRCPASWCRRTS